MGTEQTDDVDSTVIITWRLVILLVLTLGSFLSIMAIGSIAQDPNYHQFADSRSLLSLPNVFDVGSNLAFLIVGLLGIVVYRNTRALTDNPSWLVFFVGVTLVSCGSMFYHWAPSNSTLLWDRLPMTVGFMGLVIAMIGDYIKLKWSRKLLIPAVILGMFSVLYWHWSGDLRLYVWVQLLPVLTIVALMILFNSGYSHQWLLLLALGCYLLAKLAEYYDHQIFTLFEQLISGHTIKHLLAALGCFCIVVMLQCRKRLT